VDTTWTDSARRRAPVALQAVGSRFSSELAMTSPGVTIPRVAR